MLQFFRRPAQAQRRAGRQRCALLLVLTIGATDLFLSAAFGQPVTPSDAWLDQPDYAALTAKHRRYQTIAERGGWPRIPPGPTLRPGQTDARLPLLRQRLITTGDLAPEAVTGDQAEPVAFPLEPHLLAIVGPGK